MSTKKGMMAVGWLSVLVGCTGLAAAATALTGVTVSNGYNGYPGQSCGWEFTPTVDIQITKLGFWAALTNELSNDHTITIYDSAGNVKISGTVPAGNVSTKKEGGYVYVDVAAQGVTLPAGQTYTIASYWVMADYWDLDVQHASAYSVGSSLITLGKVELISPGQVMPTDPDPTYNSSNTFLSANFQFEPPLPKANAGPDVSIYTSQQAATVLAGSGADRSGGTNAMYRWLKDGAPVQDWVALGADGSAPLALSTFVPPLGIGTFALTLEVKEGQDTVSDTMVLAISNTPPEGQPASTSLVREIGVDPISVSASVADFDGDAVSYQWVKDGAVLASGVVTPPAGGAALDNVAPLTIPAGDTRFPLGSNQLQFVVNDGANVATQSVTILMQDTTVPTLAPTPSTTLLWPPNHQLVSVTIRANDKDNSGGNLALAASIQSNENDGVDEPDWYLDSIDNATGTVVVRLRAERAGGSDGRTYTITLAATDTSGNQSTATVAVRVPHDKRK